MAITNNERVGRTLDHVKTVFQAETFWLTQPTVKGILTVQPARVAAGVRSWPDNGESLP